MTVDVRPFIGNEWRSPNKEAHMTTTTRPCPCPWPIPDEAHEELLTVESAGLPGVLRFFGIVQEAEGYGFAVSDLEPFIDWHCDQWTDHDTMRSFGLHAELVGRANDDIAAVRNAVTLLRGASDQMERHWFGD